MVCCEASIEKVGETSIMSIIIRNDKLDQKFWPQITFEIRKGKWLTVHQAFDIKSHIFGVILNINISFVEETDNR